MCWKLPLALQCLWKTSCIISMSLLFKAKITSYISILPSALHHYLAANVIQMKPITLCWIQQHWQVHLHSITFYYASLWTATSHTELGNSKKLINLSPQCEALLQLLRHNIVINHTHATSRLDHWDKNDESLVCNSSLLTESSSFRKCLAVFVFLFCFTLGNFLILANANWSNFRH